MEEVDVAIIGTGVIGLAMSYVLSGGEKTIVTLERNDSFGQETSSRNSEVIHAGIRPKLQTENESFRDFVISNEEEKGFPGFINLIGIESPGLTSCLAIAETVKNLL